jgi:predicted transcriptional regulator
MNNLILISIHPEHVQKILSGEKKFEFRKKIPTRQVRKMVIYATSPIMKVVAVADINATISSNPEKVWRLTRHASGISKRFFSDYFDNRSVAHALSIGEVRELETPVSLATLSRTMVAPQSYRFVDEVFLSKL